MVKLHALLEGWQLEIIPHREGPGKVEAAIGKGTATCHCSIQSSDRGPQVVCDHDCWRGAEESDLVVSVFRGGFNDLRTFSWPANLWMPSRERPPGQARVGGCGRLQFWEIVTGKVCSPDTTTSCHTSLVTTPTVLLGSKLDQQLHSFRELELLGTWEDDVWQVFRDHFVADQVFLLLKQQHKPLPTNYLWQLDGLLKRLHWNSGYDEEQIKAGISEDVLAGNETSTQVH